MVQILQDALHRYVVAKQRGWLCVCWLSVSLRYKETFGRIAYYDLPDGAEARLGCGGWEYPCVHAHDATWLS